MEGTIVQFSLLQIAISVFSLCGTLVWLAWVGSGRFAKVETDIDWLKRSMEKSDNIIKEIGKDINEIRVNSENKKIQVFAAQSPVRLTDKGQRLLNESGLKDYIDANAHLVDSCLSAQVSNAYEVQQNAFQLFDELTFNEDFDVRIKQYAFDHGISLDIIRRVGALYFRDVCLEKIGMKDSEIDIHKPINPGNDVDSVEN